MSDRDKVCYDINLINLKIEIKKILNAVLNPNLPYNDVLDDKSKKGFCNFSNK